MNSNIDKASMFDEHDSNVDRKEIKDRIIKDFILLCKDDLDFFETKYVKPKPQKGGQDVALNVISENFYTLVVQEGSWGAVDYIQAAFACLNNNMLPSKENLVKMKEKFDM